jgi:3-oxoacyl-[acyl-carrier protein] reductase
MTVAVVTGAGRGIGREVARRLARDGRTVVVTARSADELAQTVALVEADGGSAVAVTADVTDPDAVRRLAETAEALGDVDVLVNNAGVTGNATPFLEGDIDAWWRVVEIDLRGPALVAHALLPGMVGRGRGWVVNVNSLGGAKELPGTSAYGVAKGALMRLTRFLATETAGTGVVVLDVSPGLVHTSMTDGAALFAGVPEEDWTSMDTVLDGMALAVSGRLDALSGRFVHVEDDLAALADRADEIVAADARTLRLRSYGPDDPIS